MSDLFIWFYKGKETAFANDCKTAGDLDVMLSEHLVYLWYITLNI